MNRLLAHATLPAIEIVLAAALILLGVRSLRAARAAAHATAAISGFSQVPVGALAIRDAGGLDANGRPVFFRHRGPRDRFAIFVIRGKTVMSDVAYWNSVAAQPSFRQYRLHLAAICDSPACARAASPAAKFMVIAFAENVVLLRAENLDGRGAVLEIDDRGRKIKSFNWRQQAAAVTAERLALGKP